MSRREALRLIAGTAAAGGLLVGCGSGGGSSSASRVVIGTREDPAKQPLFDDNPMIDSGLEPEKGPLRLYNWADYIYTRVLKDFEKEFGVEVELTTFYNLEEATRKLRTGKVAFDVFVPTAEIVPKFVAGKLLQPLNHDYLPNLKKNVWPMLASPYYDKGSRYTIPYTVYLTGIGWRTDKVSADVAAMDNPWEAFWDPEYKGIAGLYDDYRETIGVGLYRDGITEINGDNPDDLKAA
jgi:spermidine/putrescine transport system substrate-binding protein